MSSYVYKLQGTGNDFLIFDARNGDSELLKSASATGRVQAVTTLCDRKFGLGADGFVFIDNSDACDFKWDFYNSDGSMAEMCGNATRCVALWAKEFGNMKMPVRFETIAGTITSDASNSDWIETTMTPIKESRLNLELLVQGTKVQIDWIDSGVPHAVNWVELISKDESQFEFCSLLRNHDEFKPQGANATLIQPLSKGRIKSVSFERGVEDFTLACGTGAVAAACSYWKKNPDSKIIEVEVPGGNLKVDFTSENPKLIGPAKLIAKSEILMRG